MAYCPSCQNKVDTAVDVCPSCGWSFNNSSGQPKLSFAPPVPSRPKIQCAVDLAATVDRTGSCERFEIGIPLTYDLILAQLKTKVRDVKCWLGSHGDLDEGQNFIIHTDAGTPEQASEDIKNICYGGGGDPPEHHLDAIESLLNLVPWTSDPSRARGAIVAFMTADTKPAKSGISATELGRQIRDKGILLYLVCEPTPTLQELASAAEGFLFQISNNPEPTEMQKIAAEVGKSIAITAASGSTVPQMAHT